METPCTQHPTYFAQHGEDPAWHLTPAAHWAAQQCRNACPLDLADCAKQALTGGTLYGNDPDTQPRVASGVVQAGIACHGDVATYQNLLALAYPDGDRPVAASTCACNVCGRHFIADPDTEPDDDLAHRASPNSPLCRACYSKARRGGYLQPMRTPVPEQCLGCTEPMSPRTNRRPGTVRHESGGYCAACCRKARRTGAAA